jgi:ABC-type phosphate transport system substrate-binding protein
MKILNVKKLLLTGLIAINAMVMASFVDAPPAPGDFAVIVNKDNPIASLSAGEAKLYFLRKLKNRWPGINKNIRPATRKAKCAERDAFYATILKMTETEVETYFAEREFQKAEKKPEKVGSDAEMVAYVEQELGAIGFVRATSVTAGVKVVLTF